MSRVIVMNDKIVQPETQDEDEQIKELEKITKEFYEHDSKIKALNKVANPLKEHIKSLMNSIGKEKYSFNGYKVSCSNVIKASFDSDILLKIAKSLGLNNLIKTKEYVDEEELERMIYKGEINAEEFLPAQKITESVRLYVSYNDNDK